MSPRLVVVDGKAWLFVGAGLAVTLFWAWIFAAAWRASLSVDAVGLRTGPVVDGAVPPHRVGCHRVLVDPALEEDRRSRVRRRLRGGRRPPTPDRSQRGRAHAAGRAPPPGRVLPRDRRGA